MKLPMLFVLCALLLLGASPLSAQTFNYPNFNSVADLALNGSAAQGVPVAPETSTVLRLMDGLGSHGQISSAWYATQVPVANGFSVEFVFNLNHCVGIGCADGFAFLIQNSVAATAAMSAFGGYLGYSKAPGIAGIENSLAVEFDDFRNFNFDDPNDNHIGVQSCGTAQNTSNHDTSCNLSLVGLLPFTLPDGLDHTVQITYAPGTLTTTLDGSVVMETSVDLSTLMSLPSGSAYIGFTAGAGSGGQNADILSWGYKGQKN